MNEVRAKAWETRRKKYGQHGHSMLAYSPRERVLHAAVVIGTLREHLEYAHACLMEQHHYEGDPHGPRGTGLRAQAITHLRYALLLVEPVQHAVTPEPAW